MHHSQHLVRYKENGNAIIQLKVVPNFELKQLILSYGNRMTVLSPKHLRNEILAEIEEILKNYQSSHLSE